MTVPLPPDDYAPDGSPVSLYLRLPPRTGEAELVHGLLPAGGSVLDLGCGVGRISEPLAALGHPVTGVDNEPRMLAALRLTTPVLGDLTTLDLGRRFDAVLLLSHLVNSADEAFVRATLATARRHLHDGFALVERHPPGWVHEAGDSSGQMAGVTITLRRLDLTDGVLTAAMEYEYDGYRAVQRFAARDVDDVRLAELARAAGFAVERTVDDARRLVLLRAVPE